MTNKLFQGLRKGPTRWLVAAAGYESNVRLYDAAEGEYLRTIPFQDQHVIRLAFSGSGVATVDENLYLVIGGTPACLVVDVTNSTSSPSLYKPFTEHTEAVTAVGFEPQYNSFVWSSSEDGTLQVWLPEWRQQMYSGISGYPVDAHWGGYGGTLGGGTKRLGEHQMHGEAFEARRFENRGGRESVGLVAIHDTVYFVPCDCFFTADAKGRIRLWSRTGDAQEPAREFIPHSSRRNIQCLELAPDNTLLLAANFDGLVFVYHIQKMLYSKEDAVPLSFRANSSYITRLRLSNSGTYLACTTKSKSTKVFRMSHILCSNQEADQNVLSDETVSPTFDFAEHPGWVWDVSFLGRNENFLFTCSSNMRIMAWDLNDVNQSSLFTSLQKPLVCLAVKERVKPEYGDQYVIDTHANPLLSTTGPPFRPTPTHQAPHDPGDDLIDHSAVPGQNNNGDHREVNMWSHPSSA